MKKIKNTRDGHHLNSKYWQNYKKTLPEMPQELLDIAIGMLLGDASIYKVSHHAYLKFEQGYKQQEFLEHLFLKFQRYCFMESPGKRYKLPQGDLKSFWFKTFSHPSLTPLFSLFYPKNTRKKQVWSGLVRDYLTAQGFCYWVMCDGSLQKNRKTLILHSQGFSKQENQVLSDELNAKFQLHSRVLSHKHKYFVLEIPFQDAAIVSALLKPYVLLSFKYKFPGMEKKSIEENVSNKLMT